MMDCNYRVKTLYEKYTYPQYDKTWDTNKVIGPNNKTAFNLKLLNHYGYEGKKNFENVRILVAGCGLGTTLIHLAKDIEMYNGTVFGIDLSSSSLNILKQRLKFYSINNATIKQMSILDLNPKKHGQFDLIICVGVLHHLDDPNKGLTILHSVLKKDGVMQLMVYGQYGRTCVYQMQELLQRINKGIVSYKTKINNFKNIYAQLSPKHIFKQNEHIIIDHKKSDNGIVDLLLHCKDRAYTIPQLYKFIEGCGLKLINFTCPTTRIKLTTPIPNIDYSNKSEIEKQAINELFYGDIIKHTVFVSRDKKIASIKNRENILIYNYINKKQVKNLLSYCELIHSNIFVNETDSKNISINQITVDSLITDKPGSNKNITFQLLLGEDLIRNKTIFHIDYANSICVNINLYTHRHLLKILKYIDEKRTIQDIVKLLKSNHQYTKKDINRCLTQLQDAFIKHDLILLKHPSSNL